MNSSSAIGSGVLKISFTELHFFKHSVLKDLFYYHLQFLFLAGYSKGLS